MERVYETDLLLTTAGCDMRGRWKPSAILDAMQEAAGRHGELLGFGRKDLDKLGIVWVITRMEVQLDRVPVIGETIRLKTWPAGIRRWFFPRYFVFTDEAGTEIGRASTLWVVMDLQSRKMASPEPLRPLMPDNSDLTPPMGLPAAAQEVGGTCLKGSYEARYSDMDVNGHVNNTRYMDICCNALGIELLGRRSLTRFTISFDREIQPGAAIDTGLWLDGDAFYFRGDMGDQRCFEVGGTLED